MNGVVERFGSGFTGEKPLSSQLIGVVGVSSVGPNGELSVEAGDGFTSCKIRIVVLFLP